MGDSKPEKEGQQQIDVLLKEYDTVRADIQQTIERAKARNYQNIRYFQVFLGAIIALSTAAFRKDVDVANSMFFLIFVMYSITTIVGYLVFDMVEIQYGIEIGGARCGVIEEMINKRLNEALLVWETELAAKLFDPRDPIKGVLHPSFLLTMFQMALIAMALFSVPAYFIYAFWIDAGSTARVLVALNVLYSGVVIALFFWSLLSVLLRTKKGTRERFVAAVKIVNAKFGKHDSPVID